MSVYFNGRKYVEYNYQIEDEFENDVKKNAKLFLGADTIYIDAKRKVDTSDLGGSIPDGFLFDMSEKESPEFYLVENELQKHDFFKHIFPQVTKFFAFFNDSPWLYSFNKFKRIR